MKYIIIFAYLRQLDQWETDNQIDWCRYARQSGKNDFINTFQLYLKVLEKSYNYRNKLKKLQAKVNFIFLTSEIASYI